MCLNISFENFDNHFGQIVQTISSIIEKHVPLQTMIRKQKKIQQKSWITKEPLVSTNNKHKLNQSYF